MMTPFLSVTGGGDQENTTSLSPATVVNPTGEPDGTVTSRSDGTGGSLVDYHTHFFCYTYLLLLLLQSQQERREIEGWWLAL